MKKISFYLAALAAGVLFIAASSNSNDDKITGASDIKSISAITFGPDGILFLGDAKSATVFAFDTKDTKKQKPSPIELKNVDQKIAAALGTGVTNITITDMAVNPLSKKLYIAVQSSDGTPVLLTLEGEKLIPVALKDLSSTSVVLNNPVSGHGCSYAWRKKTG